MRIRRFVASSYSGALDQVKKELGENALILSTRSLEEGSEVAANGERPVVEITAAVEYVSRKQPNGISPWQAEETLEYSGDEDFDMKSLFRALLSESQQAQALGLKPHQLGIYSRLLQCGLQEQLASRFIEKACEQTAPHANGLDTEQAQVQALMEKVLIFKGGIELDPKRAKKVVFVGPTGAGKTTTIAKLAADFSLRQKKKVALVSLDTYRMGAFDQLRIYGDILNIPVALAHNRKDLKQTLRTHADCDLILIDTMGRCHKDRSYSGQLKVLFNELGSVETQLVLEVTAQESQMQAACKQFLPLGIDRVLFTKLDEGITFGPLVNFFMRTRIPFSYFTTGQRVPEDLEVAEKEKVIRLIFN